MSVKIEKLGVVVPGQVIRKYDDEAKETTLTLTGEQVRHLHASLGTVVGQGLFDDPWGSQAKVPHERPHTQLPTQ